jgi:multidrug resistance protein MdtO
MMWLVFDQLWGSSAAVEMKKVIISNLRLLAQLAREPLPGRGKSWRSDSLRETISENFDKVRSLADGVLFEIGPYRRQGLALRARVRQRQPQLRTLFLIRIALLKYRLQLPGFELPEAVHAAEQEFDDRLAGILDHRANRLEGKGLQEKVDLTASFKRLEETVRSATGPGQLLTAELQTFLALSRGIESIAMSLNEER